MSNIHCCVAGWRRQERLTFSSSTCAGYCNTQEPTGLAGSTGTSLNQIDPIGCSSTIHLAFLAAAAAAAVTVVASGEVSKQAPVIIASESVRACAASLHPNDRSKRVTPVSDHTVREGFMPLEVGGWEVLVLCL